MQHESRFLDIVLQATSFPHNPCVKKPMKGGNCIMDDPALDSRHTQEITNGVLPLAARCPCQALSKAEKSGQRFQAGGLAPNAKQPCCCFNHTGGGLRLSLFTLHSYCLNITLEWSPTNGG